MTTLVFKDGAWDVMTSGWSAASASPGSIEISYVWDGVNDDGMARLTLDVDFAEFVKIVAKQGLLVDLRPWQGRT